MTAALLLVVEDSFEIRNRGLVVVPGPLENEYEGPREFPVTLHVPDGGEIEATATLEHVFSTPFPKEIRWAVRLRGVLKAQVPIGTEVRVSNR